MLRLVAATWLTFFVFEKSLSRVDLLDMDLLSTLFILEIVVANETSRYNHSGRRFQTSVS